MPLEILAAAAVAVILGLIGYLLGRYVGGLDNELKTTFAGLIVLLIVALVFILLRAKRTLFDTLGRRYMKDRTGIVLTFKNLEACKEAMQEDFRKAEEVRLLLQIGRMELGYHEKSFFYNLAWEKKKATRVKILRASSDSPFLAEERARTRGGQRGYEYWTEHIRRVGKEIDDLRHNNANLQIEERQHHEPYLWRIFIFDDIAYISAYLVSQDADKNCAVYRVERAREGANSLYTVFEKYFDYLWHKYDRADERTPNERWATWK